MPSAVSNNQFNWQDFNVQGPTRGSDAVNQEVDSALAESVERLSVEAIRFCNGDRRIRGIVGRGCGEAGNGPPFSFQVSWSPGSGSPHSGTDPYTDADILTGHFAAFAKRLT